MPQVQLFDTGNPALSPDVSVQRRLNLYAEKQPRGEKGKMAFYSMPGLRKWNDFGAEPTRGLFTFGDYLYVVNRANLIKVAYDGTQTAIGTIGTSSGRVSMSSEGTNLIIVHDGQAWTWPLVGGAIASVSSFPGGSTCDVQAGRIISEEGGQFWASDYGDATTWGGLARATAEAFSDDIIAVTVDRGIIIVYGAESTETWSNVGTVPFPYAPIGGAAIEYGLAARWSLARGQQGTYGLMRGRLGTLVAVRMSGTSVKLLSDEYMARIWGEYGLGTDVTGCCYGANGHEFFQLTWPSANVTWVYDDTTGVWSEASTGEDRHIGEIAVQFGALALISSHLDGSLYCFDASEYTDNGIFKPREIITRHLVNDFKEIRIPRLEIEVETGVGTLYGAGSDPQIMMTASKDGGHTWGPERWASLGPLGDTARQIVWTRLGNSRDWAFKFRVTDPVKVALISASIEVR